MGQSRSKKAAVYGLLIALAMILSFAESRLPVFFAVPGMKLGLTNIVVLVTLYTFGAGQAGLVNLLRIVLVALLFGNTVGFFYSLAGGLLSYLIMILLKKTGKFGIMCVSISGAVAHNAGQIIVAIILAGNKGIAWYFTVLWFAGMVSGSVIGFLGGILVKRLGRVFQNM